MECENSADLKHGSDGVESMEDHAITLLGNEE